MKRKLYSLLAVLALVGPACFAQKGSALKQLPKNIEVFRPEALGRPISVEIAASLVSGHGQKITMEAFTKEPWDVYSDRDDNTTYAQPKAKSAVFSSLKFGEKVRIARFRGDFALVYSVDENDSTPYPRLPKQPEWKGWVPVANLLLWDKPLVNENGVKMRAMMSTLVKQAFPTDPTGKLFHSIGSNVRIIASLPSKIPNTFFYVLKQQGDMYLLSKDKELGADMENLFGWVNGFSINFWTNNLALEPTWEVSSVKDFASLGFSSEISQGFGESSKVGEVKFKAPEMLTYRSDYYRIPGGIWRFPYLGQSGNVYLTALVPQETPFAETQTNSVTSGILNEDVSNVNLYFVMDGSRDCEDFFPCVAESLRGINSAMPGLNVLVGAAIYHDARNEEYMTEFCPASVSSSRKFMDFIDQGGEYGFQDNSAEPALFAAIRKVLDEARFRPSETNVIILVGARGDTSDMITEELADLLDASNVSLYSIQVQNNPRSSAYQMFNYQMENLIGSKLSARAVKVGSDRDFVLRSLVKGDNMNVVNFALNTPERTYAEGHRFVAEGLMEEDAFRNCLQEIYGKVVAEVDERKLTSGGVKDRSELFAQSQLVRADGSNRSFYKYVAMYDEEEFDQLMNGFADLYNLALVSENPTQALCDKLVNFLELVPDSSPIKQEDRGYYEVLCIFEGINVIPNEYKGVSIKRMRTLKDFTAEEGRKLMDEFMLKYQKLLEIKHGAYPYVSTVNGRRCYWIPVEYLP